MLTAKVLKLNTGLRRSLKKTTSLCKSQLLIASSSFLFLIIQTPGTKSFKSQRFHLDELLTNVRDKFLKFQTNVTTVGRHLLYKNKVCKTLILHFFSSTYAPEKNGIRQHL